MKKVELKKKKQKIDEVEIKEKKENSLNLVEYKPSIINKVWGYIQRLFKQFKL